MYRRVPVAVLLFLALIATASGQSRSENKSNGITFLGTFSSPSDVKDTRTHCQRLRDFFDSSAKAQDIVGERPAVCDKVVNVVAGRGDAFLQELNTNVRAANITTDSHRRIVVTEPSTRSVHIFDFLNRKYSRIDGAIDDRLHFPYSVAVDANDNIYVTDLRRGTIAVFNSDGKFEKDIGDYKGEQAFEQPNSIAIDSDSGRIYVADSKRHFVLILDRDGKKIASIGRRGGGSGPAQFRLPTDLALHADELFVLDKKNQRIQVFGLDGEFKREIKTETLGPDAPRGMAIDSHGRIYVLLNVGMIQVLNTLGEPLFQFGNYGIAAGEFKDAAGITIDPADHLYVSDTGNQRVQFFQITAQADAPDWRFPSRQ
jgi:DNA-binding beta-propeller fold protein YncE